MHGSEGRAAQRCAVLTRLSNSLWAVLRAGSSRAGAFTWLATRIVLDNSEITALMCYIDVIVIDSCSIVSCEIAKETQKGEQEAGQR
jgi:hypothetical protein